MSKLYLQNIVEDISFENLPAKWQRFDFAKKSVNFEIDGMLTSSGIKIISLPVKWT